MATSGGDVTRAMRRRLGPVVRRLAGTTPWTARLLPRRGTSFERLIGDVHAGPLARMRSPRVAVVAGPSSPVEGWLRRSVPHARVTLLSGRLSAPDLHVHLAAGGPWDLVLDDTTGARRLERVRGYTLQIAPEGAVLVRQMTQRLPEGGPGRAGLNRLLAELARGWVRRHPTADDEHGTLHPEQTVTFREGHLVILGGTPGARPAIREAQAALLLRLRPDLGAVVRERPAAALVPCGALSTSGSDRAHPVPWGWTAAPLQLREYHDVTSTPGQILTAGSIVLPETYRHYAAPRLHNQFVTQLSPDFASTERPPWFTAAPPPTGMRRLAGSYLYLDDEVRGHFGHMTTEVLSRLWAWPEAKAADPGLKVLMHLNLHRRLAPWELQLLAAAGVEEPDIVFTEDPVRVEHLLTATQMFHNPLFVHPGIREVWHRTGDALARQACPDAPSADRIFLTRRIRKRPCRNVLEVEELFRSLGFLVVYPEDLHLPDQVALFRGARIVAGLAGSGLFDLMFTTRRQQVILVSSTSYTGRNEALIAGTMGHDLAIAWCPSEAAWDGQRYVSTPGRPRPMDAGFTFDLEEGGEFVRAVVAAAG